jgi:hypothetical protein
MEVAKPSLTKYQKDILFSPARFTVTEASTKIGKTYSHILWLYGKAMEHEDAEGKNYWWVAPVYNQAKIAFKRMRRNLSKYKGFFFFNETSLIISCPNGAEMHFKSAEKPDNLYGEDVYAAVFDEAPRAREESWYALRSTLTATEAPCKLIGNFGGISNWVHKLKEKSKDDSNYECFKVTCWDGIAEGILSREEVEQAKKDLPAKIFKELYEAEPSEDEGQLISNESINKVFSNTHLPDGVNYMTIDVARFGKDSTVIFVWSGLRVVEVVEMAVSSIPDIVNKARELQSKYNINNTNTIADEDGVGGGVVDMLGCLGFVNNSAPIKVKGRKDNFANLKSQCYWILAEAINRNTIYVDCDGESERLLTEELEWVRLPKEVDTHKISLLSKEQIKKAIGRSPDYSDALMMRMLWEVDPNRGKYFVY